ncbi:MAG: vanadium-dependent haloperoxidase, partial [Pseudomonadota bacterium]
RAVLQGSVYGMMAASASALSGCSESDAQTPPPPTPTPPSGPPAGVGAGETFGSSPSVRAADARLLKTEAANRNQDAHATSVQTNNGDEAVYADFRASFSKTLLHDQFCEVDQNSYVSYLDALRTGDPTAFDGIILGNPSRADRIGLVSPQAAYAFSVTGLDGGGVRMPNAPAFSSAETAAEMVELYWYALCRDVPFDRYDTDPLIAAAVADLNALSESSIFPGISGQITPQTVFRSSLPGATTGPLLSQFLLQPFRFGAADVTQQFRRVSEGGVNDFMTDFDTVLDIQNGAPPNVSVSFDNTQTNLFSMRQLGEFVHVDSPVQSGLYALTILFDLGLFDPTLPVSASDAEDGFVTFGKVDFTNLVTSAARNALTAAWYQKWLAHRRVRPEVFAARINVQQRGLRTYDIHPDVLNSDALNRINGLASDPDDRGLLPMGYPEGSPAHPAYPGGHSTFAAAVATMCKAFFDEDAVVPNPVQPSVDGLSLNAWTGDALTVGGELNKLVGNITHGRDGAGMHYRSDGLGNFIGEEIAISMLADYSRTYNERFDGFRLTRFDGTTIRIVNGDIASGGV